MSIDFSTGLCYDYIQSKTAGDDYGENLGKGNGKQKDQRAYVFEREGAVRYADFFDYLTDICYHLDSPTPVLMKIHLFHYAKYRIVKFRKDDFVESIDYDELVLENIE